MSALEDARVALARIEDLWESRLFSTALKLARSTIVGLIYEREHVTPPTEDDEHEALARIIWEASGEFSAPRRGRATAWGDVRVSAARQSARYIAEAAIAAGFRRQEKAS
jgi:hypothetical protein